MSSNITINNSDICELEVKITKYSDECEDSVVVINLHPICDNNPIENNEFCFNYERFEELCKKATPEATRQDIIRDYKNSLGAMWFKRNDVEFLLNWTETDTTQETPPLQPTTTTAAEPDNNNPVIKATIITVPSDLWQGKRPHTIRDGMRKADFSDEVIAYVLFNWCSVTNKTQLGKLLGEQGKDDSTYRRLAYRLLDATSRLIIKQAS